MSSLATIVMPNSSTTLPTEMGLLISLIRLQVANMQYPNYPDNSTSLKVRGFQFGSKIILASDFSPAEQRKRIDRGITIPDGRSIITWDLIKFLFPREGASLESVEFEVNRDSCGLEIINRGKSVLAINRIERIAEWNDANNNQLIRYVSATPLPETNFRSSR